MVENIFKRDWEELVRGILEENGETPKYSSISKILDGSSVQEKDGKTLELSLAETANEMDGYLEKTMYSDGIREFSFYFNKAWGLFLPLKSQLVEYLLPQMSDADNNLTKEGKLVSLSISALSQSALSSKETVEQAFAQTSVGMPLESRKSGAYLYGVLQEKKNREVQILSSLVELCYDTLQYRGNEQHMKFWLKNLHHQISVTLDANELMQRSRAQEHAIKKEILQQKKEMLMAKTQNTQANIEAIRLEGMKREIEERAQEGGGQPVAQAEGQAGGEFQLEGESEAETTEEEPSEEPEAEAERLSAEAEDEAQEKVEEEKEARLSEQQRQADDDSLRQDVRRLNAAGITDITKARSSKQLAEILGISNSKFLSIKAKLKARNWLHEQKAGSGNTKIVWLSKEAMEIT